MTRTIDKILKDYAELPEFLDVSAINVHSRSHFGDYPIHIAAVRGHVDDLLALLKAGAKVNQPGEDGLTPLHYAALFGHLRVVESLLSAGADLTCRNDEGDTASDLAAYLGEAAVVACLAAAGESAFPTDEPLKK